MDQLKIPIANMTNSVKKRNPPKIIVISRYQIEWWNVYLVLKSWCEYMLCFPGMEVVASKIGSFSNFISILKTISILLLITNPSKHVKN
jgi:hypothetical protein